MIPSDRNSHRPSRRAFLWSTAALSVLGACPKAHAEAEVPATGLEDPRLASFDRLMTSFLARHKVPGAALAVSHQGRLVYARGFGYADVEQRHRVQPGSLFRIASVSKPLTSAAVLQLVERGKLGLDDRVFDRLRVEYEGQPVPAHDPRLRQVTVRHLLHHTGGWDSDKSSDPMFRPVRIAREFQTEPPASPHLILCSMWKRPLDSDPGTRYAYSNFGYCVLGRLIEKVSGQSYETYVREHVLAPLGVHDARLGRTLPEGRARGEVRYYQLGRDDKGPGVFPGLLGRQVPRPYGGWCLEAMDAHGGWIASAPGLVRFASAFDHPDRCPILAEHGVETLFAPPEGAPGHQPDGRVKRRYYACGWNIVRVKSGRLTTWHNGLLAGTSTILVRRWDGINWAVLFNGSHLPGGKEPSGEIDGLVHAAADEVQEWPARDLWSELDWFRA